MRRIVSENNCRVFSIAKDVYIHLLEVIVRGACTRGDEVSVAVRASRIRYQVRARKMKAL
jgi:hypothetical protein